VEYTSYERVKVSLDHKEPDRVPFDIGGTLVTGINVNALRELRRYLGLSCEVNICDRITQMAETGDEIIERLKIDVKNVSPNPPSEAGLSKDIGLQDGYYRIIDEWGMGWQMPEHGGHYYDLYYSPLATAETARDIENYQWPNALDPVRYAELKERADRIVFEEKKAYVLGRMSSGMWEHAMWMRGYEKFYMDMALNPKINSRRNLAKI